MKNILYYIKETLTYDFYEQITQASNKVEMHYTCLTWYMKVIDEYNFCANFASNSI